MESRMHAKKSRLSRADGFYSCFAWPRGHAAAKCMEIDPSYHQTAGGRSPAGPTGRRSVGLRRRGRPGENVHRCPPTHVHVRGRALAAEPTPALPRACCADAYDDRLNYSPMDRMIRIHRVPWELDAQRAGCPCQPACDGVAPSRWDDTSRRPIRHVQLRLRRACRVSRCRSGRMLHLAGRCDDVTRTGDVPFVGRRCHQRTHRPIARDDPSYLAYRRRRRGTYVSCSS